MLDYNGEISATDHWPNKPMETQKAADEVFELASVTIDHWDKQIDMNISSAHASLSHTNETDHAYNTADCKFAEALSMRGEVSKMFASIGSCNISDDPVNPCLLFYGPTVTTLDDLEEMIESIVSPSVMQQVRSTISTMEAGKPKGPSAEILSKLWLISEPLAKGVIEQNTQLCCHSADNSM